MDLKNAVAVCLISLFSATLVMLIARSLDNQAAARLEPQLARIVEELGAIRAQGGISTVAGGTAAAEEPADGLVVYYFHGNVRCPTCRAIESQARQTVERDFAAQLDRGEIVWKVLNYEEPGTADLAGRFQVQVPVVVLARRRDGQIADWTRLDEVWALVGDKPAYADFIRAQVGRMLEGAEGAEEETGPIDLPLPETSLPPPEEVPVPDLPLPE